MIQRRFGAVTSKYYIIIPFAATNDLTFDSSDDEVDVDPDTTGYTSDEYLDDNVRTTFADLPD